MEENSLTPKKQSSAPNSAGNRLTALAFLEVGLFEFFFVAIVLFLLFGILNYFNILPVSDVFPKYLSWLPRQTTQTKNLPVKKPFFVPLPTPTASLEKIAQQLFSTFVLKNLSPTITTSNNTYPVIPSSFEKDAFDYTWVAKTSTVSAHFKLSSDYKNLTYLNISVITPQKIIPSAEFSAKIASQFFSISPDNIWKCKPVYGVISCENFWQEKDGIKRGINVSGPITLDNKETVISLFFCEFHKDSPLYQSTSCTR